MSPSEWTIYEGDGEHPAQPLVWRGHGKPDIEGWKRSEVVPADAHARAVSRAETAEAEVERLKRELAFVEAELRHAAAVSLLDDDAIGGG